MTTPKRNTEPVSRDRKASHLSHNSRPAQSVWAFRHRLAVDSIAAAWLVVRFVPGGKVVFLRKQDDKNTAAIDEWFCFQDAAWRKLSTGSLFSALMLKLEIDDPALRKIERIAAEADTRSASPSPLAITLTTLIQGWKHMPAGGRLQGDVMLEWATPVFDALYAHFQNQLSGPSH